MLLRQPLAPDDSLSALEVVVGNGSIEKVVGLKACRVGASVQHTHLVVVGSLAPSIGTHQSVPTFHDGLVVVRSGTRVHGLQRADLEDDIALLPISRSGSIRMG